MYPKTCVLLLTAALSLAACGGNDDVAPNDDNRATEFASDGSDISQLSDDFPKQLILPGYERFEYVDMTKFGGVTGAVFESTAPVEGTIEYYADLLGEPTINIDSGDGDRSVQWHETPYGPWIVGVLGHDNESIVSISELPAEK